MRVVGHAFYITKHGSVPLKLIPPYGHVDPSEHHGVYADICNVDEGEKVYLGLKGGGECADYEVTAEWFQGPCEEMEFNAATLASANAASDVVDLQPHHFKLGSCELDSYVDYRITVTEEDSHHLNLEIQLEDLSDEFYTSALSMYLYRGSIPKDRQTEHFTDFTNDGTYGLAVSVNDLKSGGTSISIWMKQRSSQLNRSTPVCLISCRILHCSTLSCQTDFVQNVRPRPPADQTRRRLITRCAVRPQYGPRG
jgi:hypothetical protein